MTRYNLNDRPVPGGSCEERFVPKFGDDGLNRKLGPRLPSPLVQKDCLPDPRKEGRRRAIGLPARFDKS